MSGLADIFKDCNYLLFCDETKFYKNNGDLEDEIYYFGILVKKEQVKPVNDSFKKLLERHFVQAATFHATTIFKIRRPRKTLMDEITSLIIEHSLECFCFKYQKNLLFEPTKQLSYLNSEIHDFNNAEYQALFYFNLLLNTHLRDRTFFGRNEQVVAYFDRNVYGKDDIEAFVSPHDGYVLKRMTYMEKSKISLVSLPDFFGYIFRKTKISYNRVQKGDPSLEIDKLTINCDVSIRRIVDAGLCRFLDIDLPAMGIALGIDYAK